MEQFDGTVLTTALPTIARDFGVRPPALSVTVTSYLLALAVFVPVSGYMADRFGARRVFSAAIGVFAMGSLGSALTQGLETMAAARFLQGIGGAMMLPVGRLVMLRTVPPKDLVNATSWMLMPGLMGTILGPPLGGFIVTYMHWRAIFWINIPIAALALILVWRNIPDVRSEVPPVFDGVGFVLSAVALAALMIGFETAGPMHAGAAALLPWGWAWPWRWPIGRMRGGIRRRSWISACCVIAISACHGSPARSAACFRVRSPFCWP
jgi:MFS family permease